jgi:hypothetical protein
MITGNSKSAILAILGLFVAGAFVLSLVDEREGDEGLRSNDDSAVGDLATVDD